MSHIGVAGPHIHGRDRIGAGDLVQHQGLTGNRRLAVLRILTDHHAAAKGADTAVFGNGLGINIRRRIRCAVNHLGSCIQVLALSCERDTCEFHAVTFSLQDTHRVQIGNMRTEGTGHPLDGTAFFYNRALGI